MIDKSHWALISTMVPRKLCNTKSNINPYLLESNAATTIITIQRYILSETNLFLFNVLIMPIARNLFTKKM